MSKDKNNKKIVRTVAISTVVIILIVGTLIFTLSKCSKASDSNNTGYVTDEDAVKGGWKEANEEKIKEGLNKIVEEGYINISMNTSPKFETGTSEGNLMIVNETINKYPQYVIITRNDNGEVIYKSKGIPVGSKIEKAKLSVDLPAGTYECTAMFHNVDPETGNSLGCAGAIINITILK